MVEYLEKVKEFQVASGQVVNNKLCFVNREEEFLRFDLMEEENKEYLNACIDNNPLELVDALVDKMYILLGTINTHGLGSRFEEAFNLVHENNMTKVVDGKVLRNPDGKILKPEGFVPVDLTPILIPKK